MQGHGGANRQVVAACAQCLHGKALGQIHVVDCWAEKRAVLQPGRMLAQQMAKDGVNRRLIERDIALQPVAQTVDHGVGIVGKPQGRITVLPATLVLQGLGQVPVEKRGIGRDALGQHGIDHSGIVVESGRIDRAAAGRQNPRPGHRKPVGPEACASDQVNVVGIPAIAVGGHGRVGAVHDDAGLLLENIPDAGPAPVGRLSAFRLKGRGGHTPDEVLRKLA